MQQSIIIELTPTLIAQLNELVNDLPNDAYLLKFYNSESSDDIIQVTFKKG
jgi:alpha-amylase/alpha-mannosidase (GH57 family)